ncbi:MAG: hypothetical protein RML36_03125 [Anaerolineae bacterium]|nr:DUF1858 domain-containing protein [Anaerolineae bacterium]MDW8098460.1 hypothetical protein [Anaerolineae bacterium]
MEWAALALSALAVGWGWLNWRRWREVGRSLETLRSTHYRLVEEIRQEIATLQSEIRKLKVDWYRERNGGAVFAPSMTVGEALSLHPDVAEVLAAFHIGGCASCAVSPEVTLEAAAAQSRADLSLLLQSLNALLAEEQAPVMLDSLQRRANITLYS